MGFDFVLRPGFKVRRIMAFPQLLGGGSEKLIDHATAFDSLARANFIGPAHQVFIAAYIQEFGGIKSGVLHQSAIPGPDCNVRNCVAVTGNEGLSCQLAIKNIQLPLHFNGEAVDGIFQLLLGISIEMAEPTPPQEVARWTFARKAMTGIGPVWRFRSE